MNLPMSADKRGIATVALMLSAIMVLIDMTVANVSLSHMMGALGANADQITWVLTGYSMAEAIFIPMTSFWVSRFGERQVMLVAVLGFIISSALCGQATTLEEMVFFRIIQGAFGASVIPLSQSMLVQIYPSEQKGKAMAIFSIGILLGPIFGPVVGGVITENVDWRWIFYINLPFGLVCLALIYRYIHICNKSKPDFDWWIIGYMAMGVGALQFMLDKGNDEDWFSSRVIQTALFLAIMGLVMWLYRSWKTQSPIAPLWLLKDRNLLSSSLMIAVVSMAMFGLTTQQPMMLENLLDYPVSTTGMLMAPRGIASALMLILVIKLNPQFDPRLKIVFGLSCIGIGSYLMTLYSLEIDSFWIVMPSMIQGMGLGLTFSSLSALAYLTLPQEQSVAGASIFNLFRTIGSSLGISIATTYQYREGQQQWHALSEGINPYNPLLHEWAEKKGLNIMDPMALEQYQTMLHQQSQMVAFVHTFQMVGVMFVIMMPMLFLIRSK
ncbi:MDR family MFS transporter [Vibrio sagamiensis]|uniref:MFS transporter n=1 Tax=Vibrio sagamiensis NBRC 104589 TaxID=1219064 RepID=A0A511QJU0_9VIBR|nr:MDR family MFS transporter [Vibrio sagamiensis]PNQ62609.1 MFS transporter [Vibrio agarivorans]GEM77296.1 MFS transporter [Vibrio sagamiensis NBRC 104589]